MEPIPHSSLRVLLVEDVLTDAQLEEFELRRHHADLEILRVETRSDFLHALETFFPDIVLSDFHLPAFNGMEALALARAQAPFLPFIIVTGALSEEVAAECIKAGADDYVLKDRLQRLASSIHTAREKARMRGEQVRMEAALRESEIRYRTLFENAQDGYLLLDENGCLECNVMAAELYGMDRESILRSGALPYHYSPEFQPDGRSSVEAGRERVQAALQGENQSFEWIHQRPDGSRFQAEITLASVRILDQPRLLAIVRDVTERKRKEEELRESERKYRDIVQFAPVGIYQSLLDGRFLSVNNSLVRILGYENVEEVMALSMDSDIYIDPSERLGMISQHSDEEFVHSAELRWRRRDGQEIWVNLAVHAVRDEYGAVQYFEGFVRDMTQSKHQQLELLAAKEKAEQSDRLKDAFIANMSHEIRTPLNSIIGFSDLLHDDLEAVLTFDQQQYFESIRRSSARLTRTVDQILNISTLQAGTYLAHFQEVDLIPLLERIVFDLSAYAKKKGLDLRLSTGLPSLLLILDPYGVEQAIGNLVDNAIKFTQRGGILVTVQTTDTYAEILVQDTGIGISEEYMPKLFSPFSQEILGYTRPFEGLGLGLAITKSYIVMNHGTLDVQSAKGKGTTMIVRLPLTCEH